MPKGAKDVPVRVPDATAVESPSRARRGLPGNATAARSMIARAPPRTLPSVAARSTAL